MCIWRRGVLLGRGEREADCIAFFGSFFFFKFWLGVGRTGLSGLSASPLVLRSWGGERGSGGGFASPLKASAVHSPGSS